MLQVLTASPDRNFMLDLLSASDSRGACITWAGTGQKALLAIQKRMFDLLIADERLGDMTGLACIERVVSINPMLNCALVSTLSKEDFHKASEGLGILMPLPRHPEKKEMERLFGQLKSILGHDNNLNPNNSSGRRWKVKPTGA